MPLVENDPSARIQLRRIGELQMPATCYVCGSGNCEEGYLDFGTFVDYHGTFYLCMTCFEQSAAVAGFYSPEEVRTQVGDMEQVLAKNTELIAELEEANEYVASANKLLGSRYNYQSESSSSASYINAEESDPEPERDPKPVRRSASGESESEESIKIPGRKHSARVTTRNFT